MLDWTTKQSAAYRELLDRSRSQSWKELAVTCISEVRFHSPVNPIEIQKSEISLGRKLPEELSSLYLETDGIFDRTGANIVSPLSDVVGDNLDLWGDGYKDLYMSLAPLFAFGGPGNGDRFFVPITPNGNYRKRVYLWDHENDSRTWLANGIRDLLIRCHVNLMK